MRTFRRLAASMVVLAASAMVAPAAAVGVSTADQVEDRDVVLELAWHAVSVGEATPEVINEQLAALDQSAAEMAAVVGGGPYIGAVDEEFELVAALPYPEDVVPYGLDVSSDGTTRDEQEARVAGVLVEGNRDISGADSAGASLLASTWGTCVGDTSPYAAKISRYIVGKATTVCWDDRGTNYTDVPQTYKWCAGSYATTFWFGSSSDSLGVAVCHQFQNSGASATMTKVTR